MGTADASASVDDNVRLVNLAIASIVDTTALRQIFKDAMDISGSEFKGKFEILDCETVIQSGNVMAKQHASLKDVQTSQTSMLMQLLADAQSKGDNNNNSASSTTAASVVLNQRNELYSSINQSCTGTQSYTKTLRLSNDLFDQAFIVKRGISVSQQLTLGCVQKSTVSIFQQNKVYIKQDLQSTATSAGGLDLSSLFVIFFVVLVVMMIFGFIKVLREAIVATMMIGYVMCSAFIVYEGMVFGGATSERTSAKAQLDAALSGTKPDKPGWVPSGQACFRRNWFADHARLTAGTAPPLTGYLPCAAPGQPSQMLVVRDVRFDQIEKTLQEQYTKATGAKNPPDGSVPHACIWHRNVPYELTLAKRVPSAAKVTVDQAVGAEYAATSLKNKTFKVSPAPRPYDGNDPQAFWNPDAGESSRPTWTGGDKWTVQEQGKSASRMTEAQFFKLLQISSPIASKAAADDDNGLLLFYTLDRATYKVAQEDETVKPDKTAYLYVPDPAGTETDPGIVETWPTGVTSPDGSEGNMTINGDGTPAIPTLTVKPFPMSIDVGTVPMACEQSVMMCGELTGRKGTYSPIGIGDLTRSTDGNAESREQTPTISGLDVNTTNRIEAAMLPGYQVPGPADTDAKWKKLTGAASPYMGTFGALETRLQQDWAVAGLRKPIRQAIPTPAGLARQLDGKAGPMRASIDSPDLTATPGLLETWVPAWFVGGQLVNQPDDVPSASALATAPMAAQANSVMQFMVLDRPPQTRQLLGGIDCYESVACLAREAAANSFWDLIEFSAGALILTIVGCALTRVMGLMFLVWVALGVAISVAAVAFVQYKYQAFSVGLDSATFTLTKGCPKPPAACDLY